MPTRPAYTHHSSDRANKFLHAAALSVSQNVDMSKWTTTPDLEQLQTEADALCASDRAITPHAVNNFMELADDHQALTCRNSLYIKYIKGKVVSKWMAVQRVDNTDSLPIIAHLSPTEKSRTKSFYNLVSKYPRFQYASLTWETYRNDALYIQGHLDNEKHKLASAFWKDISPNLTPPEHWYM